MKRLPTLLLSALLLLSMTACGGTDSPAPTDATASATVPAEVTTPTEAEVTEPSTPENLLGNDIMQLVNNEDMAVHIVSIENNAHTGMQLRIQCENKTDRALLFSWDMVSVCGFMYDPFWAEEVAAGKTANSTVYLDTYELEKMGVLSVDEITFTLRAVDAESWMDDILLREEFTIYPTGRNAETLQLPRREETPGQQVIAEDENLRFVIEWADEENPSAYKLHVYLENKTDRNLMYSWDKVSVNGYMIDPFWATSVTAGKKACSEITFYRSDLESNGIENVSDIEFTLLVSDYDNWDVPYLLEETYTYAP